MVVVCSPADYKCVWSRLLTCPAVAYHSLSTFVRGRVVLCLLLWLAGRRGACGPGILLSGAWAIMEVPGECVLLLSC